MKLSGSELKFRLVLNANGFGQEELPESIQGGSLSHDQEQGGP